MLPVGAGVRKFEEFVRAFREKEVRYWLRNVADGGIPPSPEALAAGSGVGMLAAIVEKYGWKNLLAIELPKGERWPRSSMKGPLFIRDFYDRAWTNKMRCLQPLKAGDEDITQPSKFVVLGTPGIGKTAFTMYCLLRVLVEKRPLRYRMHLKNGGASDYSFDLHVNEAGTVVGGSPQDSTKGYVFIHDSNSPDDGAADDAAGSLLVTSPDPKVWTEWQKQAHALDVYFPTHTREELCTLAWLTGEPLELVDAGMRRFGGVPRYVLDADLGASRWAQAKNAILKLSQQQMDQIASGALSDMPTIQHTVFAEEVDRETFTLTGQLSISPSLLSIVMEHIFYRRLVTAASLISMLEHVPAACKLVGELFEPHVLKRLAGHTFPLRQLTPPVRARNADGSEGAAIPAPPHLSFATSVECVVGENFTDAVAKHSQRHPAAPSTAVSKYVKPKSKNQAAVDFVLANGMLCNVTLARSHRIVVKGKVHGGLLGLLTACPHLIRRQGGCAYVDFLWWQLASREPDQRAGPLVLADKGDNKQVDKEEDKEETMPASAKPAAIQVGSEAVYVRQFVVPVPMTADELHKVVTESKGTLSFAQLAEPPTPTSEAAGVENVSA
ncbi:MAG: hypothetical protein EOO65_01820 [Methanosarcinales archaeon]|nr:MAG: hypothetical protein EOO65_01820 [Methanosarcinales archaeon]